MNGQPHVSFFLQQGDGDGDCSGTVASGDMEVVLEFRRSVHKLEDDKRRDLMYAIEHVPQLVETESDPMKFLQRDDFDSDAAAKRLAAYWKYRKDFFGDRAFLPMSIQRPKCAMSQDDIEVLQGGEFNVLPDHPDGRAVVFLDKTANASRKIAPEKRKRCFFYVCQVASQNEKSSTDGILMLGFIDKLGFDPVTHEFVQALTNGFPLRAKNHILLSPSSDSSTFHRLLAGFVSLGLQYGGMKLATDSKLQLAETSRGFRDKLEKLGFRKEHIPVVLGGTWKHDEWLSWMHRQQRLEEKDNLERKPAAVQNSPKAGSFGGSSTARRLPEQQQPARLRNLDRQLREGHESVGQSLSAPLAQQRGSSYPLPGIIHHPSLDAPLPPADAESQLDPYALRGLSGPCVLENAGIVAMAMGTFNVALGLIHNQEKKAYLEALEKAPELVKTESDPLRFIRVEDYDSWSAARRFVMYWELRKELFGNRAFLPLKQTNGGALMSSDVLSAETGVLALLPRDAAGRQVVAFDIARSLKGNQAAINSELRALFYLHSVLAEDERNQREGVVSVFIVVAPNRMVDFLPGDILQKWVDLYHCVPVKVKACHMIVHRAKITMHGATVDQIVARAMEGADATLKDKAIVHTGFTETEILEKLKLFGLREEGLPSTAGGTWRYEEFCKGWMWERNRHELPPDGTGGGRQQPSQRGATLSRSQRQEDQKIWRRKKNIVHSRQKRERRRAEVLELHQRKASLTSENDRLRRENDVLDLLLAGAKRKIGQLYP